MKVAVTRSSRDHDAVPFDLDGVLTRTANAYTNIMAVWVLGRALEVLELLSDMRRAELTRRLGISGGEIARWGEISRRMVVPFHGDDGIRGRDGAAPPITLCVDGEICEFANGTTRVFRLNEDATDHGAHGYVPGDAP